MESQLPYEDPLLTGDEFVAEEELIDPDENDGLVEDIFLSEDHQARIDEVLKETDGTDATNPDEQ